MKKQSTALKVRAAVVSRNPTNGALASSGYLQKASRVLCALLLNLSIIILLSTAAIFLSNILPRSYLLSVLLLELTPNLFLQFSKAALVPLLLDCLFMLAVLVLLIDGQGICHGRP